jgi:KRAB domain-containing zinc finger protein
MIKEEPNPSSIFVSELPVVQKPERLKIKEILKPEIFNEVCVLPKISYERKRCNTCKKYFTDLLDHQIKEHGHKQIFSCGACDFKADTRSKVSDHVWFTHTNAKEKKACEYCGKLVRFLEDHIENIHKGVKNYLCDLCGHACYKQKAIELHILNCHLPKNVKCPQCDFTTITKERLNLHIKNIHEEPTGSKKNFQCRVENCKKILKSKSYYDGHMMRIHNRCNEKKFKCSDPQCSRTFFTNTELQKHFNRIHGKFFFNFRDTFF